jgi:hypothetical protein
MYAIATATAFDIRLTLAPATALTTATTTTLARALATVTPLTTKDTTALATATALTLVVTLFHRRGNIFKPAAIRIEMTEKGENKMEK